MKPLFTIHAGEFLVASYIEQKFKDYLVWLPSRDSGVDLLLTDKHCKKAVSIQVKFSRDFLATHMADSLRPGLKGLWMVHIESKEAISILCESLDFRFIPIQPEGTGLCRHAAVHRS